MNWLHFEVKWLSDMVTALFRRRLNDWQFMVKHLFSLIRWLTDGENEKKQ